MFVVEDSMRRQEKMIHHLAKLTQAGKATWIKEEPPPYSSDTEYIYCLLEKELLLFVCQYSNESEDFIPDISNQEPSGICSEIRNTKFLWLPSMEGCGWHELVVMLKTASVNSELYRHFLSECENAVFNWIEYEASEIL
jgi:hypothetical protein